MSHAIILVLGVGVGWFLCNLFHQRPGPSPFQPEF